MEAAAPNPRDDVPVSIPAHELPAITPQFWNNSTGAIFLMVILCQGLMEAGVYSLATFTRPWVAHFVMSPIVAALATVLGSRILASQRSFRRHLIAQIDARDQAQARQAAAARQLAHVLSELESHNSRLLSFSEFTHTLLSCVSEMDIYDSVTKFSHLLFPNTAGGLYLPEATGVWKAVSSWPANNGPASRMRLNKKFEQPDAAAREFVAVARRGIGTRPCVALPIISGTDLIGIFYIEMPAEYAGAQGSVLCSRTTHMVQAFCEEITLAFTNLRLRSELSQQAIRDPLTGLYNRRYMEEAFARELKRAERQHTPVAVLMIDLDYFKQLNDQFGHDCGDAVLKGLGGTILWNSRGEDIACRYGGEEILMVLPNTGIDGGTAKAQQIRSKIKKLSSLIKFRREITASIGIACYPRDGLTVAALVKSADAAMYTAKRFGRNRICRASEVALATV